MAKTTLARHGVHYLPDRRKIKPNQVVFRISGCEDRVILVDEINNRSKELHRPNLYSQSDIVYNYLLLHSNRVVSNREILASLKKNGIDNRPLTMTMTNVVGNLKFTGELRRLFFRASKNYIKLYNPITFGRMQEMHIAMDDILPYFE